VYVATTSNTTKNYKSNEISPCVFKNITNNCYNIYQQFNIVTFKIYTYEIKLLANLVVWLSVLSSLTITYIQFYINIYQYLYVQLFYWITTDIHTTYIQHHTQVTLKYTVRLCIFKHTFRMVHNMLVMNQHWIWHLLPFDLFHLYKVSQFKQIYLSRSFDLYNRQL
jgi:hypothetical protein